MASEPNNKNDYQQREEAVDAAFQNPDNVVIPVDLDQEMKKVLYRLRHERYLGSCASRRARRT